jgi:hypothetical protein
LPRSSADALLSDEQRIVLGVLSAVRLADVQALSQPNEYGVRRELDTLLADMAAKLAELARGISHKYLVHAGPAYQLAEIPRRP